MRRTGLACSLAPWLLVAAVRLGAEEAIELTAKDTLTALEMDLGDRLKFRLSDGHVFEMVLEDTEARIIERVEPGGIIYYFSARVRISGQSITLARYVCSQECFYEPYMIHGVRLWLDTVRDVFDHVPIRYPRKGNLRCLPRKRARFALQDAQLRICPEEVKPWIADERDSLNVADCYNGDDCYLGPYLGRACHVGLDVNHTKGSKLSAPIGFDTQAYFNSLETGHNNNRWRGIRRWPNGDVWALQSHHLIELLVSQNTPLKAGAVYATTAGVYVGSHEHSHFEFKVGRPRWSGVGPAVTTAPESIAVPIDFDDESEQAQNHPEVLHLDPWIVFWQLFEDRKARRGDLRVAMNPARPVRTGRRARFSARASGGASTKREYYWTFGDGGFARGRELVHVFPRPGMHPVTVTVDDGENRVRLTQHIAVSGEPLDEPALILAAVDVPSFRRRPVGALDVHGRPIGSIPHTVAFVARPSRPRPESTIVRLRNVGGGTLSPAAEPEIRYAGRAGWLRVTREGDRNEQRVRVEADASAVPLGLQVALVSVSVPEAVGSPGIFRVELRVPAELPSAQVTIDDQAPGFHATSYFWVGHRFSRCPPERRGYRGFYLTNGARAADGEYARFTPDLQAGHYRVSFRPETPFLDGGEWNVRVHHGGGDQWVRVQPTSSRTIGRFDFDEGADGFVEIHAGDSTGLVIADAVTFEREPQSAE